MRANPSCYLPFWRAMIDNEAHRDRGIRTTFLQQAFTAA
jgi:hypothetical protein